MSGHEREQSAEAESQANTRQDRNAFLTDGGTWTWTTAGGTLTWSADFKIMVGGVAIATVSGPSSVAGMTLPGDSVYVTINRVSGGGTLTATAVDNLASSNQSTDDRLVLGTVGDADGKFYFRNGTVMSDGDSKAFGTLNSVTDRSDVVSTGVAVNAVGFTYLPAANQLAVYVGGILMVLGTHYTETPSTTQITFLAGHIPAAGELITFVNVVGGQGPSGASTLQGAYNGGDEIDTTAADLTIHVFHTTVPAGLGKYVVTGSEQNVAGLGTLAGITNKGFFYTYEADGTGGTGGFGFKDNTGVNVDAWMDVPLDDGSGDAIFYNNGSGFGFLIEKATGALEFGKYTPGQNSYPGGAWVAQGTAPVRHAYYTGTTSAIAATLVTTFSGGETIVGAMALIDDADVLNQAWVQPNQGSDAAKSYALRVGLLSNEVRLCATPYADAVVGGDLQNRTYHVVVFYKD